MSIATFSTYAEGGLQELIINQQNAMKEGRLTDAIDFGKIALTAYRNGQSDTLIWCALDRAGDACVSSRRYIEALDFYMVLVEFADKNAHSRSKTIGLNNIGNIYETFGDYERAKHYFTKAYEHAHANNYQYMLGASLLNLINVCSLLGDTESAEKYYQEQQKYALHTPVETLFWHDLSRVSIELANKNYNEAIRLSLKARATAETNGFRQDLIALTYDRIGKAYFGLGMADSVISSCNTLITQPDAMALYPDLLINAYSMLADTYNNKGMKDRADRYKLLSLHLSDSLFNRRKFNAARDLIVKYEDNEVQSHIFRLNDRIHTRNIWIIAAMAALMVALAILIIIHINNRRLHKANELLVSKNKDILSQANESQRLREQLVSLYEQIEEYKHTSTEPTPVSEPADEALTSPTHSLELSEQQLVVLLRNITRVMQDQKVISDSSFSIGQLAQMVNSNTTYVSAAINQTYQKNFKTYLNEHRVQLAAQRLLENDSLTIQAIAESAGFKSASNFIAAFKKVMGMNPSIYRKHGGFASSEDK